MSLFGEPLRCQNCLKNYGTGLRTVDGKSWWVCIHCNYALENPETGKIEEEARQKALKR
jgi:hypothetical protein